MATKKRKGNNNPFSKHELAIRNISHELQQKEPYHAANILMCFPSVSVQSTPLRRDSIDGLLKEAKRHDQQILLLCSHAKFEENICKTLHMLIFKRKDFEAAIDLFRYMARLEREVLTTFKRRVVTDKMVAVLLSGLFLQGVRENENEGEEKEKKEEVRGHDGDNEDNEEEEEERGQGIAERELPPKSKELMHELMDCVRKKDADVYFALIKGYLSLHQVLRAEVELEDMERRKKVAAEPRAYNAFIQYYMRRGQYSLAEEMFERLKKRTKPDFQSYASMVRGYLKKRSAERCQELLEELQGSLPESAMDKSVLEGLVKRAKKVAKRQRQRDNKVKQRKRDRGEISDSDEEEEEEEVEEENLKVKRKKMKMKQQQKRIGGKEQDGKKDSRRMAPQQKQQVHGKKEMENDGTRSSNSSHKKRHGPGGVQKQSKIRNKFKNRKTQ